MISDFIWLDRINDNDENLCCLCSLPNPNFESDDEMVACGSVKCEFNDPLSCNDIDIVLSENFKYLYEGDLYQRKHFAQTVAFILNLKFGINSEDAHFHISDNWGYCDGRIEDIDATIR